MLENVNLNRQFYSLDYFLSQFNIKGVDEPHTIFGSLDYVKLKFDSGKTSSPHNFILNISKECDFSW